MTHTKFHYASLDDIRAEQASAGCSFPLNDDLSSLKSPLSVAGRTLKNRIAIQPMEGSDGTLSGAPGELTVRRYDRFAASGAALIWFEAVAISAEVKASPRQLHLTEENLPEFSRLVERMKSIGLRENGFEPMIILQATHSGRYSKPEGVPAPLIAYNNPVLEDAPIDASRILTDDQLERYEAMFAPTARLAKKAGFDGMDVKCCHRYLINELFSAYTREGKYGGSFENRTRFLMNAYRAAESEAGGGFFLTSRMNAYDGFPYPWGFGVTEEQGLTPVLTEAVQLIGQLIENFHIPIIDITIGNPYKNPHVNRPYDVGNYVPPEHPFEGIARMMKCVSEIQRAYPSLPVIGSGFTYLRQFSAQLAAGMVSSGGCQMAGFGRMGFANPNFPNQILDEGGIDPAQVCITCGQCALLLRGGGPSGCVVRDRICYGAAGGGKT